MDVIRSVRIADDELAEAAPAESPWNVPRISTR
jgi:hypothetical protein